MTEGERSSDDDAGGGVPSCRWTIPSGRLKERHQLVQVWHCCHCCLSTLAVSACYL